MLFLNGVMRFPMFSLPQVVKRLTGMAFHEESDLYELYKQV
jgi:hypothetical protein